MSHKILPVGLLVFVLSSGLVNSAKIATKGKVVKEFDVGGTWRFDLGKGQEDRNGEFWYRIFSDTRAVIRRFDTSGPLANGPEEFNPKTGKTKNGLDVIGPVYSAETHLGKVLWKIAKIDTDRTISIQIIEDTCDNTPYKGCGISPKNSRIIGGDDVSPHSIPWQVGLLTVLDNYEQVWCGGTLLTDKHVLTAAHCLFDDSSEARFEASDIRVVVGEHEQYDSSDGVRHEIRSYTKHPRYDPQAVWDYDFSIVHLTLPVELGDRAVPACLPDLRFSDDKLVGKYLTVSGWGMTDFEDRDYPDLLQSVDMPVVSQEDCREVYGSSSITNAKICAGYSSGGMGSCHRDSGGPLTYEENGKSFIIGVVSWGVRGCVLPGYPSVFARVTTALDWIHEELGSSC